MTPTTVPAAAAAAPAWARLAAELGVVLEVAPVPAGGGRTAAHAAGRVAAARALARAGGPEEPVGRADDGRACWPAGWTGSISHRGALAVAAVARRAQVPALGIDLEEPRALPAADAGLVLSPSERALVARRPDGDAVATMLWSAKEAAFKAWSGALGGLEDVDPTEIEVELGASTAVHGAGALAPRVAALGPLRGRVVAHGGWVLSLLAADPSSRPAPRRPPVDGFDRCTRRTPPCAPSP